MRLSLILAGLLSLLLAGGHTWWGLVNAMPGLSAIPALERASFEVSWHQVAATLAVGGLALILAGAGRIRSPALPGFILTVYAANFLVFLAFVASRYPQVLARTVPQFALFLLMLALIALGTLGRRRAT